MTTKIYWNDSHIKRFTARIQDSWLQDGDRVVVLDQSAFYPTGGGQPCDTGRINSARVTEVDISDDERILHRLNGNAVFTPGEEVECEVDWSRRLDLMQQHSGQHILSQAFFQLFGAETRGFRINDRLSEIDLTLEAHPEAVEEAIVRAEDLANIVVFENREIRMHEVTPNEAAKLPLRKESFITDCIRVIEIAGYDWSPCGGTHVKQTGEVGLIAVRGCERAKNMTRVHFVCGGRVLSDYRAANRTAEAVARKFSVGRDEAEISVTRLFDENKRLTRRVRELAVLAAKVEAQELIDTTSPINGIRIVSKVFEERDLEELKLVAHRLVEREGVIALLAARESEMVRLVFACSSDVSADMNTLMKRACEKLGGRGGGKADFAQGGGPRVDELENTIDEVKREYETNENNETNEKL
ncbi:MAG: DHHA1 domain-containing protein [Acidobacteria bacterium]|nr:DHHA1 domain-containing protein [Acidobacteriota bacterium]